MAGVGVFDVDADDTSGGIDELLALVFNKTGLAALGDFVSACMANQALTPHDLAAQLGTTEATILKLMTGQLPVSEISETLLVDLAMAINYEPNILRILLGQPVRQEPFPSRPMDDESFRGFDRLLDEINDYLLGEQFTIDPEKIKHFDFVVRQISMIIQQHQTDIKLVETMVAELKDDQRTDLHRLDVRRIIHHLKR